MKYMIRSIGWVFDDSVFEKDSLFKTVATYTDRTEALEHLNCLNRAFFLTHLSTLYQYKLWDNFGEARQVHREELDAFFIREFGFNPTIAVHP